MQSTAGDAQCFIAADESWFSLAIDVLARGPLCLAPTWPPARVHTRRVQTQRAAPARGPSYHRANESRPPREARALAALAPKISPTVKSCCDASSRCIICVRPKLISKAAMAKEGAHAALFRALVLRVVAVGSTSFVLDC